MDQNEFEHFDETASSFIYRADSRFEIFMEIHRYQSVHYASFQESIVYKTDFDRLNERLHY